MRCSRRQLRWLRAFGAWPCGPLLSFGVGCLDYEFRRTSRFCNRVCVALLLCVRGFLLRDVHRTHVVAPLGTKLIHRSHIISSRSNRWNCCRVRRRSVLVSLEGDSVGNFSVQLIRQPVRTFVKFAPPNRSLQQTPASLAARLRRLALRAAAELRRSAS